MMVFKMLTSKKISDLYTKKNINHKCDQFMPANQSYRN